MKIELFPFSLLPQKTSCLSHYFEIMAREPNNELFWPYQSIVLLKGIHKILPFFMDVESTATNVFYRKSTKSHHSVRPWHLYRKENYHIKNLSA